MLQHIPNLITLMRILAIMPLLWALWQDNYRLALGILLLAGLSDALDGFLARRYGWITPLGAVLDPLADKLFIVSIMLLFGARGFLPLWLVAIVFARDLIIVSGALLYRRIVGNLKMRPLLISKLNTALQILLLLAVLLHVSVYPLPDLFHAILIGLVAVSTISSGAAYVFMWASFALNKEHS